MPQMPPLSVVLTDWLSIAPAAGEASGPSQLSYCHDQQAIDHLPEPDITPSAEIALHCGKSREVLQDHAPDEALVALDRSHLHCVIVCHCDQFNCRLVWLLLRLV